MDVTCQHQIFGFSHAFLLSSKLIIKARDLQETTLNLSNLFKKDSFINE